MDPGPKGCVVQRKRIEVNGGDGASRAFRLAVEAVVEVKVEIGELEKRTRWRKKRWGKCKS